MTIAVACTAWPGIGPASEIAEIVWTAWDNERPHHGGGAYPVADGGPLSARDMALSSQPVGGIVAHDTALGTMVSPASGTRWNPADLLTGLLGWASLSTQPSQIIVPVGDADVAGDPVDVWGSGLEATARMMSHVTLTVAVSSLRPLLGLNGMSAALRVGRESDLAVAAASQAQESRWAEIARPADALAADRDLLSQRRLSDQPGTGAAGGLAYCLAALGARITLAAPLMLSATRFAADLESASVAVAVTGALTPHEIDTGLARAVADAAAAAGIPCIVVSPAIEVGKRDLMAAGIVGAYECAPTADDLADEVTRIARTWSMN